MAWVGSWVVRAVDSAVVDECGLVLVVRYDGGGMDAVNPIDVVFELVGLVSPFLEHTFELPELAQFVGVGFRLLGVTAGICGCGVAGIVFDGAVVGGCELAHVVIVVVPVVGRDG